MSVEHPPTHNLHETAMPIERVVVASANIIDMIGDLRGEHTKPFFDAFWDDSDNDLKLELQSRRVSPEERRFQYDLIVYTALGHQQVNHFCYDTAFKGVATYDADNVSTTTNTKYEERLAMLAGYLATAPVGPRNTDPAYEGNDVHFMGIMAANKIYDPRIQFKIERLGRQAFGFLNVYR